MEPAPQSDRPKFELVRLLAVGDKATVYEAILFGLHNESVAVKVISLSLDEKLRSSTVARLHKSFDKFLTLKHQNVVMVKSIFENPPASILKAPEFVVIMELCSGGSLKRAIRDAKEIPVQNWTKQLLNGLDYLHSRNIVHANIKPTNIMFSGPGEFCGNLKIGGICDTAPLIGNATQLQELSHTKGTFVYMSPEMIQGYSQGVNIGRKTDIWSVGCVILELLTRKPAQFENNGVSVTGNYPIMYFVSKGGKPNIPTEISDQAKQLLDQCLQSDPEQRSTAQKLLQTPFITCDAKMD